MDASDAGAEESDVTRLLPRHHGDVSSSSSSGVSGSGLVPHPLGIQRASGALGLDLGYSTRGASSSSGSASAAADAGEEGEERRGQRWGKDEGVRRLDVRRGGLKGSQGGMEIEEVPCEEGIAVGMGEVEVEASRGVADDGWQAGSRGGDGEEHGAYGEAGHDEEAGRGNARQDLSAGEASAAFPLAAAAAADPATEESYMDVIHAEATPLTSSSNRKSGSGSSSSSGRPGSKARGKAGGVSHRYEKLMPHSSLTKSLRSSSGVGASRQSSSSAGPSRGSSFASEASAADVAGSIGDFLRSGGGARRRRRRRGDDEGMGERDEAWDPHAAYRDTLESLDYEVIENGVYRDDQARRGRLDHFGYVTLKWTFALLLGIATGLAAFFINVAVEIFAGWKFVATSWLMHYSYLLAFLLYAAFNVGLVFSSAYIVTTFAPAAAGSGIPEIKGYLNGIDMPGILLARTLLGKVLGSIGSVAGGLALGKEGPLVHTGACLAALIIQGGSTKYRLPLNWMRVFRNDRDRRDMVTCGAAAGAAAAFRAPVGGVLFALEEVTSWWRSQLLWRVFFTSAVVAVVLRGCMRWCSSGECGKFASGGFIIWDVHGGAGDYFSYELLPMAMLGLIGGLMGAFFNQLTRYVSSWRRNGLHKRGARVKVLEACLVALITSLFSFATPLFASCKQCPDPIQFPDIVCPRPIYHWGNFVSFNCAKPDQYNDLATIFFNTQDDAIRNLFSSGTMHEYSANSLITFLVIFFSLAVLTYGIAVPSGQFVPGIMIGATYGRLVGMLMVKIYGTDKTDEGTYALLGAASFLGGSMRMTVSLCVIMVEITNNLNLLPLIMLVLLISKAVGDGLNPGFYDLQAFVRGIPILDPQPKRFMRMLTARHAATTKVNYFSRVEMVGRIVEVLRTTSHNGYPVIEDLPDGSTAFAGLILRSQLLVLLHAKVDFQPTPNPMDDAQVHRSYSFSDFAKPVSSKGMSIADVEVDSEHLTMWLDLKRFLNPTPYLVDENMSLTKVYTLFRQLGLRHLCVVPCPPRAVGIITRKDLVPEVLEERHTNLEEMSWVGEPGEAMVPPFGPLSPWSIPEAEEECEELT